MFTGPGARRRHVRVLRCDVEHFGAHDVEAGPGCDQDAGECTDGRVAGHGVVAVPGRIANLGPLVGAHHHGRVTRGDVGDQLRVGDRHAEPRPRRRRPPDRGGASLDARMCAVLLAEGDVREREIDAFELRGFHRRFRDGEMRDRQRVERTGIHTDYGRVDTRAHGRRIGGCRRVAFPRRYSAAGRPSVGAVPPVGSTNPGVDSTLRRKLPSWSVSPHTAS